MKRYSPLRAYTGLFRTFANLPLAEEGILRFVHRYGMLSSEVPTPWGDVWPEDPTVIHPSWTKGEGYLDWRREITQMRDAIMLRELIRNGMEEELSRYIQWSDPESSKLSVSFVRHPDLDPKESQLLADVTEEDTDKKIAAEDRHPELLPQLDPNDVIKPARFYVARLIDQHLEKNLGSKMNLDHDGVGLHFDFVPSDLLSAMWLQFALGVSADCEYRACSVCGTWFELSPETARTSRRFCSDPCKAGSRAANVY